MTEKKEHHKAICVLTARGLDRILAEGGTQAWVLDNGRAARFKYVVCVQNRGFADDWGKASATHHAAFVVGKLKDVVEVPNNSSDKPRWLLTFSEYAEVDVPGAWPGYRNPVWYTDLEGIGIELGKLSFKPMPALSSSVEEVLLTIPEAKRRLAKTFGVDPNAIEITVRG
ncbi:hypothetical protein [Variovorax sp. RA8]|uniref:hypothetical protein n=1 Tax=Variovorax sp. (strain JCM 16519 / RA8) TaxID=662548 RepID=UPI000A8EE18C|nr:hypothetical protein [Variovorax sp. RA8]VTU14348.1 hypothetical protein RA8CHR_00545 [Variovorax sp. RA8]